MNDHTQRAEAIADNPEHPAWNEITDRVASDLDDPIVDVIFRKYHEDGDVVAVFPGLAGTSCPTTCLCYQHVGQHGSCDPHYLRHITAPATDAEAEPLRRELERIGYRLRAVDMQTREHYADRCEQCRA